MVMNHKHYNWSEDSNRILTLKREGRTPMEILEAMQRTPAGLLNFSQKIYHEKKDMYGDNPTAEQERDLQEWHAIVSEFLKYYWKGHSSKPVPSDKVQELRDIIDKNPHVTVRDFENAGFHQWLVRFGRLTELQQDQKNRQLHSLLDNPQIYQQFVANRGKEIRNSLMKEQQEWPPDINLVSKIFSYQETLPFFNFQTRPELRTYAPIPAHETLDALISRYIARTPVQESDTHKKYAEKLVVSVSKVLSGAVTYIAEGLEPLLLREFRRANLTEKQQNTIYGHYYQRKSFLSIAKDQHIGNKQTVHHREENGIKKLREHSIDILEYFLSTKAKKLQSGNAMPQEPEFINYVSLLIDTDALKSYKETSSVRTKYLQWQRTQKL